MKRITLFDFRKLCEENGIVKFTFSTVDQKWDTIFHTLVLKHEFDRMSVQSNPNQVCFLNSEGEIRFERIKYVKIYKDRIQDGLKFSFICGDYKTDENNIEYVLHGEKNFSNV